MRTTKTLRRKPKHTMANLRPLKYLTFGALLVVPLAFLLNPASQQVETLSIKSIAKNLLFTQMSQKKNFLPVPVPIPVRIELNDPPVFLKGKPRYVPVYKKEAPPQQPIVKPTTVYHMPVYSPTYEYMQMTDPLSVYSNMMMAGHFPSQYGGSKYHYGRESSKESNNDGSSDSSHSAHPYMNFNDYDDESGGYYSISKTSSPKKYYEYRDGVGLRSRSDADNGARVWILPVEEQESLDEDGTRHRRVKRQAYHGPPAYEREPPCYGFPLEVNIKSRIKLDQIFPIHGKSQYKKCIKVGRPLLPPVEDDTHY